MSKLAHCIHHTHWDLIWYFTAQDATVQFSYNMKEMLEGFRSGAIKDFFMDGQTMPIVEYVQLHPEDEAYMKELITSGKLVIGPFQSQLDCFICNGESIINNLRIGMKSAKALGKTSKIAYLPDSFGHSSDFPKIFTSFGIHDFVITRGVGDNYGLDSEFYMQSNDGSKVLVCTMIAGYGYGCYPFKEGTLFKETALDYNKLSVHSLINRLLEYSTLEDEFVFPLGFDQNPAMFQIAENIQSYNEQQKDIVFQQTSWEAFCARVRKQGKQLRTHQGELFSTQYHRLHKSIFSARSDIKALQDECERMLSYELQPLMSMLDAVGIPYDHGLIDKAWDTLLKCQTHSSATLTDETNEYIERESRNALQLATSATVYLMKLVTLSLEGQSDATYPLMVVHTIPQAEQKIVQMKVLTKTLNFHILDHGEQRSFSILKSTKKNCGVLRRDVALTDPEKFYYETDILLETGILPGISYTIYDVVEDTLGSGEHICSYDRFIENERYQIYRDEEGIIIYDKKLKQRHTKAIYLEESGDEGDSFDYSYPSYDKVITDHLEDAEMSCISSRHADILTLKGTMFIPKDLKARKRSCCETKMPYELRITLKKHSDLIQIDGSIDNASLQHRVRFVVRGLAEKQHSYAGTQFGYIERETRPKELQTWREDGWFEEPSPTFPLLNHVSMKEAQGVTTVFTRSSKEYELMNTGCKDMAITLFRSYGAMGYPDLHRRPGRPSGLDYMVFETPECQMLKRMNFALAIQYEQEFDANAITNAYVSYASDVLSYQKQNFDKSLYPIAYFPTNPWKTTLPRDFTFLHIEDSPVTFGSVVKSDSSEAYLIRLYNSEQESIVGGKLHGWCRNQTLALTNLEESNEQAIEDLPNLAKGELRILKCDHKK